MLFRRFQVFFLTLIFVTLIYHLLKDSSVIIKSQWTNQTNLFRNQVYVHRLHTVIADRKYPTRYEDDITALYAFAPIETSHDRSMYHMVHPVFRNIYRRRSSH